MRDLVAAVPADAGLCLVVIQHLAPDHPSIMDQLLSAHSKLPVKKIEHGVEAAPNTIFVIPAGPSVTIENGCFFLHPRKDDRTLRTPIDEFLISLADNRGRNAYSVILSGTGSDGSAGLRAIKSEGGVAFAQLSDSAKFPGMPDSAVATGLVDFVLPPKEIPGRLIDIIKHRGDIENGAGDEDRKEAIQSCLPEFLEILKKDGHDFSEYKHGTLIRRIERRMSLRRISTVNGFLDLLREDANEREFLRQDFLIGVTRFFRDEEAFEVLEKEVIPSLLDSDRQGFRLWVPACSTGEEAYSIAMLMKEALDERDDRRAFQVFGTDIDIAALAQARSGFYTQNSLTELSEERRRTFFQKADARYQVSPILRECCVFAPHNLLKDPPFSRLDLISCRNLMIYLTADVQQEVIPRLHYALNPGGYLMLGPSESLGGSARFFTAVDREQRVFRRNDREAVKFSSLPSRDRVPTVHQPRGVPTAFDRTGAEQAEPDFESQVSNYVLKERAPPYAVVNSHDEVVYVSERMGSFLKPSMGLLSPNLDQILARELRLPVRSAILDARSQGGPSTTENIVVREEGEIRLVDLHAEPLPFDDGHILVTLVPVRTQDAAALADTAKSRSDSERDLVHRELALTRKQLRKTEAEFDTTEQELKSSNEELLSMNEELQSSNEELETSREELQSINEELETINAELSENNRQLIEANSDLQNLFESTEIATVFLDQNLCVRRYTPTSRRLFSIQDRDLGRPINDLAWKVDYDELEEDAAEVGRTLQPIEREVMIDKTNETFMMRIKPYRRIDDRIDGCVVTFFDITARKRFERQIAQNADVLARQYAELEQLYDTTPVGLNLLDQDLRYIRINERLAEINGFLVEDHIGKTQEEMLPEADAVVRETQLRVLRTGEPSLGNKVRTVTPAEPGKARDFLVDYYPVRKEGKIFAVGSCVQEVTEQVALQRELERSLAALEESEQKLRRLFDQAPVFVAMHEGPEHRYIYANPSYQNAVGGRDVDGKALREALPELEGTDVFERFDKVFRTGEPVVRPEFAASLRSVDGTLEERWYNQVLQPWFEADRSVSGVMSFAYDITEEVEVRNKLSESEARLASAMRAGRIGVHDFDPQTPSATWTDQIYDLWGFERGSKVTYERWAQQVHPDDLEAAEAAVAASLDPDGDGYYLKEYRVINARSGAVRWVKADGEASFDGDKPVRLVGTVVDITETVEASERQDLLLNELQHRVKNTLATILAIVQFSSVKADDVQGFTKSLSKRVQALSRTHDLLTADNWVTGSLREVIAAELRAYGEDGRDRFSFEGFDAALTPKQMLALALAFHELTTNAAKYGSLSTPDGRIAIQSEKLAGHRLRITWKEKGGPAVEQPEGRKAGFGTFLIERVLSADLKGLVEANFEADGFSCVIEFPLRQVATFRGKNE